MLLVHANNPHVHAAGWQHARNSVTTRIMLAQRYLYYSILYIFYAPQEHKTIIGCRACLATTRPASANTIALNWHQTRIKGGGGQTRVRQMRPEYGERSLQRVYGPFLISLKLTVYVMGALSRRFTLPNSYRTLWRAFKKQEKLTRMQTHDAVSSTQSLYVSLSPTLS